MKINQQSVFSKCSQRKQQTRCSNGGDHFQIPSLKHNLKLDRSPSGGSCNSNKCKWDANHQHLSVSYFSQQSPGDEVLWYMMHFSSGASNLHKYLHIMPKKFKCLFICFLAFPIKSSQNSLNTLKAQCCKKVLVPKKFYLTKNKHQNEYNFPSYI